MDQALGIAAIRNLGFALLPVDCALPAEHVSEQGQILLALESFYRVVVEAKGLRNIAATLSVACEVYELARTSGFSLHQRTARLTTESVTAPHW